jgi:excisionase family DNA binding protein
MTQTQEPPVPAIEWMTVAEVADYLRVTKMTVRRAIDRGDLATTRIGRSIRVDAASVRARYTPAKTS